MKAFTCFIDEADAANLPIRAKAFNYKLMYVNVNTTDASTGATALYCPLVCMCDVNGVSVTSNTTFDTHQ
jgi:hypothetical protein